MHPTAFANRRQRQSTPNKQDLLDWALCFVSLLSLVLITQLATAGAALYLAPWGLIVIRRRRQAVDSIVRNAWLLALPALCIVSTAWSDYQAESLRAAVQFLITVVIAIWASECVKPRIFLSALFLSILCVIIISLVIGTRTVDEVTGEVILVGVFRSKNQLAFYAVIFILVSATLLLDASQTRWVRLLALCGLGLGPTILIAAKSAGSAVFCVPGVLALLLMRAMTTLSQVSRAVIFIVTFIFILPAAILGALSFVQLDTLLEALGKDTSLTGRTELWESAFNMIEQYPLLGFGFQGFWRIGNPEAEKLWYISHVPAASGFNFHNLYLNTLVDLGLLGGGLLVIVLLSIMIRLILAVIAEPKTPQLFAVGVFIYLLLLSSVEAIHLYQFHLAGMLLPICWCYARPAAERPRAASLAARRLSGFFKRGGQVRPV